jgi:phage terminase large subunit-like protein
MAGRGFGKTRVGAEQVRQWIKEGRSHVNLIAATNYDLRHVMVDGESGILSVCPPDERPLYKSSTAELIWPSGATSLLFSAEEPDRLRGPQADAIWADEIAAWNRDQDSWDMAMLGLRLGSKPQIVATTTPRPTKMIRKLMSDPTTAVTRGTTYENRSNLAPTFYSQVIKKYEGTRLGRQELNAEVLDDNPGALFRLSDIDKCRISSLPDLSRIIVAMDPAVTSNADSDEWGIVAAGKDRQFPYHFPVLVDESGIYTPDQAAKQAVRLYHRLKADRIVGEANNGGDMIEALIRHEDPSVSYKKVIASRGKAIRAEPISALYEQGRVHHHGTFAKLEDQMTSWNPATDKKSPDRLDALVWALTEVAEIGGHMHITQEIIDMAMGVQ